MEEDEDEEEVVRVGFLLYADKSKTDKITQTVHKKSEMLFVRGMFVKNINPLYMQIYTNI